MGNTMRRLNMAKKIFIVSTVLILAIAGLAFASGQKEPAATAGAATAEKLTLTGNVYVQDKIHPVLKSGGKEYELMVPPYLVAQIDLKEGSQITIEGYTVQGMGWHQQVEGTDDDIDVRVTKATINGKDYDLGQYYGPMMGGQAGYGRGGMMRGRGAWGPGARL
jgi:hypothetical protein